MKLSTFQLPSTKSIYLVLGSLIPMALNSLGSIDSFKKYLKSMSSSPQEKNVYRYKFCITFQIFNDSQRSTWTLSQELFNFTLP